MSLVKPLVRPLVRPLARAVAGTGAGAASKYFVTFDGSDDWISVPNSTELQVGATDYALAFWFQRVSGTATDAFSIKSNFASNNYPWYIYHGSGNMRCFIRDSSTAIGSGDVSLPLGEWHHVVMSVDITNDELRVYKDGVLGTAAVDISTIVPAQLVDTFSISIGSLNAAANPINARIGDFRILTEAPDASVAASIMTGAVRGTEVLHYKFEELAGTSIGDSSGEGNTGTANDITEANFWDQSSGSW